MSDYYLADKLVLRFVFEYYVTEKRALLIRVSLLRFIFWFYTINQVILSFWFSPMIILLEDRHTIDVITTKFFLLHLKNGGKF